MDDESCLTHQTVLSLLKFIRDGECHWSEGPIFYPLKFESANIFTALAESIRPFTCYDCVSQMTNDVVIKSPPLHMHGSNLLINETSKTPSVGILGLHWLRINCLATKSMKNMDQNR